MTRQQLPVWADAEVPESGLDPQGVSRRGLIRGARLLGAFWPGQFSRMHVGVRRNGYLDVLAGLREGRVWVDHGQLVDGLSVRVRSGHGSQTLGGRLTVRRGERVTVDVTVTPATRRAPDTRVEASEEVRHHTVRFSLGRVTESCYVRLRGSDGNRHGAGCLGASHQPRLHRRALIPMHGARRDERSKNCAQRGAKRPGQGESWGVKTCLRGVSPVRRRKGTRPAAFIGWTTADAGIG